MKYIVIGNFAGITNQLCGQSVKTRSIYNLAKEIIPTIDYFDTQNISYNKLSIFTMLWKFCISDYVIYLPAARNMTWFFPIFYLLSLFSRTNILQFEIGNWMVDLLAEKPIHRWMLGRINQFYAETQNSKRELECLYNLKNISIFSNFRYFNFKRTEISRSKDDSKLRLVFCARINRKKGLDYIFSLGDYLIKESLDKIVTITFYGPVFEKDKEYFFNNLNKYSFMKYGGMLQQNLISEKLQSYDCMLLPTQYYTEGLPGSIIDAYIVGIPVIVTKWKNAEEYVKNDITGIIVPFKDGQKEFNQSIVELIYNKEKLQFLKDNAYNYRQNFHSSLALIKLRDILSLQ